VVTRIKSSEVTKKSKVTANRSSAGLNKPFTAKTRSARKPVAAPDAVEDAAYTEDSAHRSTDRQSAAMKNSLNHMVARGKDLVSGDATSVAAAAAIVVGAALIEVELIPGLIIGAGAVLLGKLFPEMGDYVRPAIKGALRTGFYMAHKAREVIAETSEQVHDLVAEVAHESQHASAASKAQTVQKTANSPVSKV